MILILILPTGTVAHLGAIVALRRAERGRIDAALALVIAAVTVWLGHQSAGEEGTLPWSFEQRCLMARLRSSNRTELNQEVEAPCDSPPRQSGRLRERALAERGALARPEPGVAVKCEQDFARRRRSLGEDGINQFAWHDNDPLLSHLLLPKKPECFEDLSPKQTLPLRQKGQNRVAATRRMQVPASTRSSDTTRTGARDALMSSGQAALASFQRALRRDSCGIRLTSTSTR